MGKQTELTAEQLAYLKLSVSQNVPATVMAAHIGCCTDTLKRILMRHKLAHYEGAKYATSVSSSIKYWSRPCLRCKDAKPRPKWQYVCDACKALTSDIEDIF